LTLVVHLIDFNNRNSWIENQLDSYQNAGIEQGLISFSDRGNIHEHLDFIGLEKNEHFDRGLMGFIKGCLTLKSWANGQDTIIYAHGHIPAIFASFFRTFTGVCFVICHHQPSPKLFAQLRKRIFFRAIIHSILARYYYWRASLIQVLSLEIENVLLERGLSCEKIIRIPLGLEFKNFYNLEKESKNFSPADQLVIVSISRLAWEKRIDLGIRTVAHLIDQGFKVKYSVVGTGPELDSLKSLTTELKVSEHVDFLGQRDDINTILNGSDLLFHLSTTEAYGQVLMEARLTELPIFTSPCGVALDMEDGGDPYLKVFRSEDALELAGELRKFVLNLQSRSSTMPVLSGSEKYMLHDYQRVIPEVVSMFVALFASRKLFKR
jgi:glycosyltransferase involved in cell wall biosynthesis